MTNIHPAIDDAPWPSIPAMFREVSAKFADRTAVSDNGRTFSYSELQVEVDQLSRALIAVGIKPDDKVAQWLPNSWQWIVSTLAIQQVGAVLIPLNTRFKAAELDYILGKSKPSMIFYQAEFLGLNYAAELARTTYQPIIRIDIDGMSGDLGWDELLTRGLNVPIEEVECRLASVGPRDLSDIMFTSGTTGRPKGVLSLHGQVLRAYQLFSKRIRARQSDVFGLVIPFFHSFGYKAGWVLAFMNGAKVVPIQKLDTMTLLNLIAREGITYLPGPPTIFFALINEPRRKEFDISSLRFTVVGTTNVPAPLIRQMREELGFEAILQGYGITEATAQGATSCWGDSDELVSTTAGPPHEEMEMRIVDLDGNEAPPGTIGQIWLRGFYVMTGYFQDEEATREALTSDGWLMTGDLGSVNEHGYVTLHGRKRDMIIVGGFNAYPAEIEDLLSKHPAVLEAAVVGKADERLGEVPVAFVVARQGADLTEAELIGWARDNISNFKVPRRITFLETLPRNASGKVVKGELPA